ncbi:radical SAM protein [Kitasatospora sp. NRRL B-11411]|uniref:radical SAM protein n=1 Tax=Kitasatospora sp. NRRL B-11411 TaxID=1463822 RepID=UPI0004C397FA|nr:radical SAM protein [Kitasatospora sp. NRRL B-11411]
MSDTSISGPAGFEQITTTAKPSPYSSATKVLHTAAGLFPGRQLVRKVDIAPAPHSLEMYLTMNCNVDCTHCYAQDRNEEYGFADMPVEMAQRLHASIAAMGVRGVQYCGGGEPTLWRGGEVADLIAGLDLATTRAGMASNLVLGKVLARPEVLARMTFIEAAVFAFDNESYRAVAGGKKSHSRMEESVRAILAAWEAAGLDGPKVNAKVLINNVNYRWLEEIYDWSARTGFDNIHIRLVDDYENKGGFTLDPAQREEFREHLTRFCAERGLASWGRQIGQIMGDTHKGAGGAHSWCWTVARGLNCWVIANGEVYICGPQWGRQEYLIGDLREADLEEIWGGEKHRQVASRLISNMGLSGCYKMGCRHIHQSRAIEAWAAGDLPDPDPADFETQHAWFL